MIHEESHPLSGHTVTLPDSVCDPIRRMVVAGAEFEVEDYWDRITGGSWATAVGNPAAIQYAMRAGFLGLPADDEVVYGHIDRLGHLVHVSELPDAA